MQESVFKSLGWKNPPEKEMATHFNILAWRIPWTEEPGRLQSLGLQRVRHTHTSLDTYSWKNKIKFNRGPERASDLLTATKHLSDKARTWSQAHWYTIWYYFYQHAVSHQADQMQSFMLLLLSRFSHVQLFATRDPLQPGSLTSPALPGGFFTTSPPWEAHGLL